MRTMRSLVERARAGDGDGVYTLVERGCSPNEPNAEGELALVVAVAQHRVQVVRILLELGADPNLPDGNGTVPLERALEHVGILRSLLASGADPNRAEGTPLVYRAAKHPRVLSALLEHGADPNAMTGAGETALGFVSDWGYISSAEILIAADACPTQLDPATGRTPLVYAAENGRVEILERLLDIGADPTVAGPGA